VIEICPESNLCLESLPFTIFSWFFSINEYKSKYGGVQKKCRGYGYHDMFQMKELCPITLIEPFNLNKKAKLNAQNNPHLGTSPISGTFIVVHSIFTFVTNMRGIGFWLDHLVGIGELGMVENA